MGYGSPPDDSPDFAQIKKSLLGKTLRVDINNMPGAAEVKRLCGRGNYSIPADNPYIDDNELEPEIWALGIKNDWHCSFDSKRPSYFMCGDPGQNQYEEVDIITKGGNYGWRAYEGPYIFHSVNSSPPSSIINPIFPLIGYNHSTVDKKTGSASIAGGYFYQSMTDPCMYGRYLFTDLYNIARWAASEVPKNSGNFTTANIPFSCARDSSIQCSTRAGSSLVALGYVFSLAEDKNKDVYILTSSGVYRVARPSHWNYQCSMETSFRTHPEPHSSVSISGNSRKVARSLSFFSSFMLIFLEFVL